MPKAVLTISSRNYGAWALRGWLMAKLAKLDFTEHVVPPDDPAMKAEILLLSPSILVPCLTARRHHRLGHAGHRRVPGRRWRPGPACCRPIGGACALPRHLRRDAFGLFQLLRSALPMNLKGDFPKHKVWSRALGDIERIGEIWRDGLQRYGGPYLFGPQRCMADAMYAPVVTRFLTYHVQVDAVAQAYCKTIMALPEMKDWVKAAQGRARGDQRTRHGFLITPETERRRLPLKGATLADRQSRILAAPACEGATRFDYSARGRRHRRNRANRLLVDRLAKSAGLTISMYSMSGE
jgi:glutathione S-transferase